ncbi:hypothetical protein ml_337 [Mollivirus sibericum]|uniref:hypothetical protein n=1 Tax=Mollivirus sibericum TaxID=1678078 RepID=UPI0006B2DC57|nr:hypothetical protein ml_337 [Mollivirus sibericum]ALD62139.1 hypothetical protein ml_337 [Mollivirus sibericum]
MEPSQPSKVKTRRVFNTDFLSAIVQQPELSANDLSLLQGTTENSLQGNSGKNAKRRRNKKKKNNKEACPSVPIPAAATRRRRRANRKKPGNGQQQQQQQGQEHIQPSQKACPLAKPVLSPKSARRQELQSRLHDKLRGNAVARNKASAAQLIATTESGGDDGLADLVNPTSWQEAARKGPKGLEAMFARMGIPAESVPGLMRKMQGKSPAAMQSVLASLIT